MHCLTFCPRTAHALQGCLSSRRSRNILAKLLLKRGRGEIPQQALLGQPVPNEFAFAVRPLPLSAQTQELRFLLLVVTTLSQTKVNSSKGEGSLFPQVLGTAGSCQHTHLCHTGCCPLCLWAGGIGEEYAL